jgi:peptide/nickel transport system permease protein
MTIETESLAAGPSSVSVVNRGRTIRRLLRDPFATAGLVVLLIFLVVAICAPLLAPFDPNAQELVLRLKGPSGEHWLGTDDFGRDQLSRLIFGARISLYAASEAVAVAVCLGVPLGMLAGYVGGSLDSVLSRIADGLMSVPALVSAFMIVAVVGPGLTNAMFAIGVVFMPRFFRVARASTQQVREETFIEGARVVGCSPLRIVLVHVFPNALSPILVQVGLVFGSAITAESSLSFLGVGVQAPTASWGSMLFTASNNMLLAGYLVWAPGIAIALTVLAFMLFGEGLRRALGVENVGGRDAT